MATIVTADITTLLDAITTGDEDGIIQATLRLLGPGKVPPAKIAARVGIPAAWAGGDGHPLSVLSVAGRVAEWMRSIPIGPEPGADERRMLAPALPLVQGFLAVADRVKQGLPEPHPVLPDALVPADVKEHGGSLGAFRDAFAKRDLDRMRAVLMGYYATGADYKTILSTLYATLESRYPQDGHPLIFTVTGARVLDMADWGDRVPAYIYWVTPLLLDGAANSPAGEAASAYAADSAHNLGWLRTRLSIPKEEAAGPAFQRALVSGDFTTACDAALKALRDGATPIGVAAGIALAAAEVINAVPKGDRDGLTHAAHALLYANAVHTATKQTQDQEIWPLLYTAACVVNAAHQTAQAAALPAGTRGSASVPMGGLIAASMLRTFEAQLAAGDTDNALSVASRYLQMGHPSNALAGMIGAVAASRDVRADQPDSMHILPFVAAAAEEYLNLPAALQAGGQNALLGAAIRLAGELTSGQRVADHVRAAINAMG
ncbi:MAG: hypothetical protein OJF49_004468 [Ktedonobacterales bacterium]|jgi:hypothetical protein|nr:MAG: hypothetical protein OJF49_004468 [Ktedonobacterales bacterium]